MQRVVSPVIRGLIWTADNNICPRSSNEFSLLDALRCPRLAVSGSRRHAVDLVEIRCLTKSQNPGQVGRNLANCCSL